MAAPDKEIAATPDEALFLTLREKYNEFLEDLLSKHGIEWIRLAHASENGRATFTLTGELDTSESEIGLKVTCRYTKTVTDSRSGLVDTPMQEKLAGVDEHAKEESQTAKAKGEEAKQEALNGIKQAADDRKKARGAPKKTKPKKGRARFTGKTVKMPKTEND